jgi:tetratricopeptide (TPR) repeat protein
MSVSTGDIWGYDHRCRSKITGVCQHAEDRTARAGGGTAFERPSRWVVRVVAGQLSPTILGVAVCLAWGCGREAQDHPHPATAMSAVDRFPGEADLSLRRGRTRLQLGSIAEALADYRRSLSGSPTEGRFAQLGKDLWEADAKPAAIELWNSGLERFPESLLLHRNLGFAYYDANDFRTAVSHYRKAAAAAPRDTAVRTDLAWALLRVGSFDEARALCERTLAEQPGNQAAQAVLAAIPTATASAGRR